MAQFSRHALGWTAAGMAALWLGRTALRSSRRFEFRDRSVLITGGSRGLGLLLAHRLVDQGARVALCARDAEELEQARSELAARGAEPLVFSCDVSQREELEQVVRAVERQWGEIDILINNAGLIQVGPQSTMTIEDYEQAMAVHFWGPLYAVHAVLPGMRERGQGRIINIASIGGKISVPHMLPYSASKYALVGLSEGLRAELLKDGIYVTTVCPGPMRTGSHVNARFKGDHAAESAWFSVSAAAPLLSMNAGRAADQILSACRDGRAEVILSMPARIASVLHGILPGMTADALGTANRMFPDAESEQSTEPVPGWRSRPLWLPGWLTRPGDRAAVENNELVQHKQHSSQSPG